MAKLTQTTTRPFQVPRTSISARLEKIGVGRAAEYAQFIRGGEQDKPLPCWGAIAERFTQDFVSASERLVVLDELIQEGDKRPLFLFIHTAQQDTELLEGLIGRAGALPVSVQRALVALPEAADLVPSRLDKFGPVAQALWKRGAEALYRENEVFEARTAELLSFRFYVPDEFDPLVEPGTKALTEEPQP